MFAVKVPEGGKGRCECTGDPCRDGRPIENLNSNTDQDREVIGTQTLTSTSGYKDSLSLENRTV